MRNMPSTSVIHFATLLARFPNIPAKTYVGIPATQSIQSLENVSRGLEKFSVPEISAQAFISIEISNDRFPMIIKKLVDAYKDDAPDSLIFFLEDSIVALVETLIAHQPATSNDETETIELQILNIEKRVDTIPGMVIETSHGHDIASDMEWWGDRDFPGSVIGHISIEILSSALVAKARECLEAMYLGEPEKMEEFIGDKTLDIAKKLLAA